MKLISTSSQEDLAMNEIIEELQKRGIYVSASTYSEGFGGTVWSTADLDAIPESSGWSEEKRLAFFDEMQDILKDNATINGWDTLAVLVPLFSYEENSHEQ